MAPHSASDDSAAAAKLRAFIALAVTTGLFAADIAACISIQHAWSM